MATQPGECDYCGEEFDHLPSHEWQCPEKPDDDENDVTESDAQDSDEREPEPETVDETDAQVDESQDVSGVQVDDVNPEEKDTRKNKESQDSQKNSDDEWVELDYNSGKQVKTILKTTEVDDPKQAQKLLKAFKTGNVDDIPKFDEIRLSDGELR